MVCSSMDSSHGQCCHEEESRVTPGEESCSECQAPLIPPRLPPPRLRAQARPIACIQCCNCHRRGAKLARFTAGTFHKSFPFKDDPSEEPLYANCQQAAEKGHYTGGSIGADSEKQPPQRVAHNDRQPLEYSKSLHQSNYCQGPNAATSQQQSHPLSSENSQQLPQPLLPPQCVVWSDEDDVIRQTTSLERTPFYCCNNGGGGKRDVINVVAAAATTKKKKPVAVVKPMRQVRPQTPTCATTSSSSSAAASSSVNTNSDSRETTTTLPGFSSDTICRSADHKPQTSDSPPSTPTHVKVPLKWLASKSSDNDRDISMKHLSDLGHSLKTCSAGDLGRLEKHEFPAIDVHGVLLPKKDILKVRESLEREELQTLASKMGPMSQPWAILRRSGGNATTIKAVSAATYGVTAHDPPYGGLGKLPVQSQCSSSTNPLLGMETRSSQCHEEGLSCGGVGVASATAHGDGTTSDSFTFFSGQDDQSDFLAVPDNYSSVIGSYSKVAGYDASKDEKLRRAYHLLQESKCYYGKLSMHEARRKLKPMSPGYYLVRDSSDPQHLLSLSVKTARGTTSIRISYSMGLFQLDCEQEMASRMPTFDCIMKLLKFYTQITTKTENNMCVFLESSGRRDTPVVLLKPLVHSVGSLKASCRKTLNGMLSEDQRRKLLLFMPPGVEAFLEDYPYAI